MKEIQTNGITILLVEVPEDAKAWSIKHHMDGTLRSLRISDDEANYELCVLPQGQYQILGKSTELSEEQMKEICEFVPHKFITSRNWSGLYKDYRTGEYYIYSIDTAYLSLLEANGICDRFLISEPPENIGNNIAEWEEEYQKEKSKVKHYLVLKRI